MRRTADLATFLEDPVGLALIGPSWIYFCQRPDLFGFVLWGVPVVFAEKLQDMDFWRT